MSSSRCRRHQFGGERSTDGAWRIYEWAFGKEPANNTVNIFENYVRTIFTGNRAFSSRPQTSVLDLTAAALPVTFELAIFSIVSLILLGTQVSSILSAVGDSI